MSSEGVLGKDFEGKLKSRPKTNKQIKDLFLELNRKPSSTNTYFKSTVTPQVQDTKVAKTDFSTFSISKVANDFTKTNVDKRLQIKFQTFWYRKTEFWQERICICIWYVVEPNYDFNTTGRESAGGDLYWRWFLREILNASKEFACTTLFGRWFKWITVFINKECWYCCFL